MSAAAPTPTPSLEPPPRANTSKKDAALADLTLPYPGLRPFEESDGPIFFGREAQIAGLLRQLERNRFVAVIGSSGSGKSSLVKAGLLPAIKRGFLMETTDWAWVTIRPQRDPYGNLTEELLKLRPPLAQETAEAEFRQSFRKTLRLTDAGLVKALPTLGLGAKKNFLIVVDQFEELFSFRLAASRSDDHASRDDASAFVSMLLTAFRAESANIWIVLTMRSDFIGNCEAFLDLPENVSQSQFLVPRLDAAQMEEAIVRPGLVKGAGYDPFTVPGELVNIIINDAGDRQDQLPLMQHALMRTWKKAVAKAKKNSSPVLLTEEQYEDVGGINKALNNDAEEAWKSIKGDKKLTQLCRHMFMLLCDVLPGGRIVRRRPLITEVARNTRASNDEIETILRVFREDDRSFLLPSLEDAFKPNACLDIAHESLFRQWERIQEWIRWETESAANYRDLLRGETATHLAPAYCLPPHDTHRLRLWRDDEKPTEGWAARYGGNFDATMRFLDRCIEDVATDEERKRLEIERKRIEAERQRIEEEKQKELKRKKQRERALWVLAALLLLAGVLAWFTITLNHTNQKLKSTNAKVKEATDKVKLTNTKLNTANFELNQTLKQRDKDLAAQTAIIEAQKATSNRLQASADKSYTKSDAQAHFNALRLYTRSLRVYSENIPAQIKLCQLLQQFRWCSPITPQFSSDIATDKYALAATLLPDRKTLLIATQEGNLLQWKNDADYKRLPLELPAAPTAREVLNAPEPIAEGPERPQPKGHDEKARALANSRPATSDTPHKSPLPKITEAYFSDDGRYLAVVALPTIPKKAPTPSKGSAGTKGEPAKPPPNVASIFYDENRTGNFTFLQQVTIGGGFAGLHTMVWAPDNRFLLVSTLDFQRPDQTDYQLLELRDGRFEPNEALNHAPVSAACFSADGRYLFTASPPVEGKEASDGTPSTGDEPAKIWQWPITGESENKKIGKAGTAFPLPAEYPKPYALTCNRDGTYVATNAWGYPAVLIDIPANTVRSFRLPDAGLIMRILLSPSEDANEKDMMLIATTNRISCWKASELGPTDTDEYELGKAWIEPITFQGMGVPTFTSDGRSLVVVSGGSFRNFDSARAWDLAIKQTVLNPEQNPITVMSKTPDWLLDLSSVLTGNGRPLEGDEEQRPFTLADVYSKHANDTVAHAPEYRSLWDKFTPGNAANLPISQH